MNIFFSIYNVYSILILPNNFMSDLIIPIWVFWVIPIFWPVIFIVSFLFCSAVLSISMRYLKIQNRSKITDKTIVKITLFGFLCELLVIVLMWVVAVLGQEFINPTSDFYHWYSEIFLKALIRNVFENVFAFLTMCLLIMLSRIVNYKLNRRYTFSKLDIEEENKKKLALSIAIFTAPYIFFIPLNWILK